MRRKRKYIYIGEKLMRKTKNRGVEKERDGDKGWKEMEMKGREREEGKISNRMRKRRKDLQTYATKKEIYLHRGNMNEKTKNRGIEKERERARKDGERGRGSGEREREREREEVERERERERDRRTDREETGCCRDHINQQTVSLDVRLPDSRGFVIITRMKQTDRYLGEELKSTAPGQ